MFLFQIAFAAGSGSTAVPPAKRSSPWTFLDSKVNEQPDLFVQSNDPVQRYPDRHSYICMEVGVGAPSCSVQKSTYAIALLTPISRAHCDVDFCGDRVNELQQKRLRLLKCVACLIVPYVYLSLFHQFQTYREGE
ncbi:hypothetical protein TNCV_4820761 [Trichonephila clavipes]|nr:hypothetical protein TNCV_4820761 [Trichonephila clavipes]